MPTPLSLARLMDALADPAGVSLNEREVAALRRLLRQPSLVPNLYRQLLRAGADAGLRCRAWDFLADAAESEERLERLLVARGWRCPAEVLDPEGRRDVDYGQILAILEARLQRGEGDPHHLGLVRRRLQALLASGTGSRALSGSRAPRPSSGFGRGSADLAAEQPRASASQCDCDCGPGGALR